MDDKLAWWNKKHKKYATESWVDKTSIFAEWAAEYFPGEGKILELGAGHGQDSRFFAGKGYEVTSTDFSGSALEYNLSKTPESLKNRITVNSVDISKPLPFGNDFFDVVYCNLSLHYFDDLTTDEVFKEIYRVLKPKGIVAILVNSINDPEYGQGEKIEQDYYELVPGDVKHFFSKEYMKRKTHKFETILLDSEGTSYKDTEKGVFNLIRYIGRKPPLPSLR